MKSFHLSGPWNNEVWNGNSESSAICQYVCQSVLFVQPIRSFNLISMLVHCLHMKITTCLLVLINQLRKWDNSFSCELVSSLSAYESSLIYLEQSCHSILSSSMVKTKIVWIMTSTQKIKKKCTKSQTSGLGKLCKSENIRKRKFNTFLSQHFPSCQQEIYFF